MTTFKFLWKKQGKRWMRLGGGITFGSFCISTPGTYKMNTITNGWWGTPDIFEITEANIQAELRTDGKLGPHGMGLEVS